MKWLTKIDTRPGQARLHRPSSWCSADPRYRLLAHTATATWGGVIIFNLDDACWDRPAAAMRVYRVVLVPALAQGATVRECNGVGFARLCAPPGYGARTAAQLESARDPASTAANQEQAICHNFPTSARRNKALSLPRAVLHGAVVLSYVCLLRRALEATAVRRPLAPVCLLSYRTVMPVRRVLWAWDWYRYQPDAVLNRGPTGSRTAAVFHLGGGELHPAAEPASQQATLVHPGETRSPLKP